MKPGLVNCLLLFACRHRSFSRETPLSSLKPKQFSKNTFFFFFSRSNCYMLYLTCCESLNNGYKDFSDAHSFFFENLSVFQRKILRIIFLVSSWKKSLKKVLFQNGRCLLDYIKRMKKKDASPPKGELNFNCWVSQKASWEHSINCKVFISVWKPENKKLKPDFYMIVIEKLVAD